MYTIIEEISNGSKTLYDVTFDLGFSSRDDVYVYSGTDHDLYQTQLDYTWPNNTQIELVTPVTNGVQVNIRRVVNRNELICAYADGTIIHEANLDKSFKQALMILQEIKDGFNAPLEEVIQRQNLDMNNHLIKNVLAPVDAGDAVNLETLQDMIGVITGDPLAVAAIIAAIGVEEGARIAADVVLQDNIDAEAVLRDDADTLLEADIVELALSKGIRYAASVAGTANAATLTFAEPITAFADTLIVSWIPTADNSTTTPTIKLDALATKTVVKIGGALAAGDIRTGYPAIGIYNTALDKVILINPRYILPNTWSPVWVDLPAQTTLTAGTNKTFTHSVGSKPYEVVARLACTSTDLGYAVGKTFEMPYCTDANGAASYGCSLEITNTTFIVHISTSGIALIDSSGTADNIDPAKWSITLSYRV